MKLRKRELTSAVAAAALAMAAVLALPLGAGPALAQAPGVTAFEGARLIFGDERAPVENGTIVIDGTRILQAGAAANVNVPAGARHVDLTGKTVMPTIVDTHTHLSHTRDELIQDLTRRAFYGVGATMSLGQDTGDLLYMRDEMIPGASRYLSAGRGITVPEPGCSETPYWINNEAEARKAVDELAAKKVDIVKLFVDDWGHRYPKMTPAEYGAIINEAHKNGLRATAHIRDLVDAKGLMRAGIDAFAHSVRTSDIDDEAVALYKTDPKLVVNPNLPDRGVKVDLSWLAPDMPAEDMAELQKRNTDRPQAQAAFAIQARNTARLSAAGIRTRARNGRELAVGTACRDGRHGDGRHDADAGHHRGDPQRRRIPAPA